MSIFFLCHILLLWYASIYHTILKISSTSLPEALEDRDVLDGARDGVRVYKISIGGGGGDGVKVVKISQGSFTDSFTKIQHQKPSQDSTYHPSLFLESWRTWRFLMDLVMESGGLGHP